MKIVLTLIISCVIRYHSRQKRGPILIGCLVPQIWRKMMPLQICRDRGDKTKQDRTKSIDFTLKRLHPDTAFFSIFRETINSEIGSCFSSGKFHLQMLPEEHPFTNFQTRFFYLLPLATCGFVSLQSLPFLHDAWWENLESQRKRT